jgi:agmatinase
MERAMEDHEIPDNFLGLPEEVASFERARVVVLPLPFEATVSYGHGTREGPAAIIEASKQVELYDREFDDEPALRYGIHTLPALTLSSDPAQAVAEIAAATAEAARSGKFVVGLGGEHTVSVGFGQGLAQAFGGPLALVQIDAHSDLRDEYQGSPLSHACIARRLAEHPDFDQVIQLGIRSVSREEVDYARANPEHVHLWYAEQIHEGGWRGDVVSLLSRKRVFLTIDVDGLDPSVVSATGTPEPDGLTWHETLDIIRTIARAADVVGMDCVELAPAPNQHASDFAVAKLLYKALNIIMDYK